MKTCKKSLPLSRDGPVAASEVKFFVTQVSTYPCGWRFYRQRELSPLPGELREQLRGNGSVTP